jgi:hypothetical protein
MVPNFSAMPAQVKCPAASSRPGCGEETNSTVASVAAGRHPQDAHVGGQRQRHGADVW